MANSWSIKIVTLPGDIVAFQPDVPGAQPGQALGVSNNDLVTWNNRTNDSHWPHAEGTPLTADIPAGQVSSPILKVTELPITYICKHHEGEQGTIVDGAALVVASAGARSKSKKRIKKKKSKGRKKQKKRSRK